MERIVFAAKEWDSRGLSALGLLEAGFDCAAKVISEENGQKILPLDVVFFTTEQPDKRHDGQWLRTAPYVLSVPQWAKASLIPIAIHPSYGYFGNSEGAESFKLAIIEVAKRIERWFADGCKVYPWSDPKSCEEELRQIIYQWMDKVVREKGKRKWKVTSKLHRLHTNTGGCRRRTSLHPYGSFINNGAW